MKLKATVLALTLSAFGMAEPTKKLAYQCYYGSAPVGVGVNEGGFEHRELPLSYPGAPLTLTMDLRAQYQLLEIAVVSHHKTPQQKVLGFARITGKWGQFAMTDIVNMACHRL